MLIRSSRLCRQCLTHASKAGQSKSLHTTAVAAVYAKFVQPMRARRDLPEPEHTNTYAGAVYVEEMFDELHMNLNDHIYNHEGDRVIDDMMIRRFMNCVFSNQRAAHAPMRMQYKELVIKRRLNHLDISMFFERQNIDSQVTTQLAFLTAFCERILSEMFGVIVELHVVPCADATDLFKNRERKYELGTEWTPLSV